MHSYSHIHTYTHTHIHTYTNTQIHTYTHSNIHIYTQTQIHTHQVIGLDLSPHFLTVAKRVPEIALLGSHELAASERVEVQMADITDTKLPAGRFFSFSLFLSRLFKPSKCIWPILNTPNYLQIDTFSFFFYVFFLHHPSLVSGPKQRYVDSSPPHLISRMNETCHKYNDIMTHIWMLHHDTHMNESCHNYKHITTHIWMLRHDV